MCGKDTLRDFQALDVEGSPPHVRERPRVPGEPCDERGITPACAGKTLCELPAINVKWDHPRMCGKDLPAFAGQAFHVGSPPHVRERLLQAFRVPDPRRITPACAGKTHPWPIGRHWQWDHPRMCGKDWYIRDGVVHVLGSPPHVRERLNYGLR